VVACANGAVAVGSAAAGRAWLHAPGGSLAAVVMEAAAAIVIAVALFCLLSALMRPAPRMVKMEMVAEAAAEDVFAVLHDVSKYTSWHPSMRKAAVATAHADGQSDEITLEFGGVWNFFVRKARISRYWQGRRAGGARSMYIEIPGVVRGGFVVVPLGVDNAKHGSAQHSPAKQHASSKMPQMSLLTHSLQLAPSGFAHLIGMNQLLATQQMLQIMLGVRDEIEQGRAYHRLGGNRPATR
jgi:hypothetical protein